MRTLLIAILLAGCSTIAADVFIRTNAVGSATGDDWSNALTNFPASLTRGNTYWVADGLYSYHTYAEAKSGTSPITVKKATVADHGTSTGWDNAYGDGQAHLGAGFAFNTSYVTIDGNGTHTVPSATSSDYGFIVTQSELANTWGIVQIANGSVTVSNITLRYVHFRNEYNGSVNNGTVGIRFYPGVSHTHIKIQNCFLENTGKDGIQISNSKFLLFERCYFRRLGRKLAGSPDYHGQTVQMFYLPSDVIFRWNVWDRCEGQALIAYGEAGNGASRVRFYGNVVFNAYGTTDSAGFNTSGGLIGNAWAATLGDFFIYNNSWVNLRNSFTSSASTATHFPIHASSTLSGDFVNQNNILFNCEDSSASRFTAYSHNASGGYGVNSGSSSDQTGLESSIFTGYTSDDFRLASGTTAGADLTAAAWWNDDADEFFGQLDYATDIYGNTRGADGTWDIGAYEYVPPAGVSATIGTMTVGTVAVQ